MGWQAVCLCIHTLHHKMEFGCLVGLVSCAPAPLLIPNSITFPASCSMSLDHISTISVSCHLSALDPGGSWWLASVSMCASLLCITYCSTHILVSSLQACELAGVVFDRHKYDLSRQLGSMSYCILCWRQKWLSLVRLEGIGHCGPIRLCISSHNCCISLSAHGCVRSSKHRDSFKFGFCVRFRRICCWKG